MLLHGGASTWREWAPVLPILTRERDVIAMKAPGHHEGPPVPAGDPLTVPDFADAFERELDGLGLGAVDVAGHSYGGWQALELGRRGRARRVVALAPSGGWTQEEAARTEGLFHGFIPRARRWRPVVPLLARTSFTRTQLFTAAGSRGRHMSPADAVAFFDAVGRWPLGPRIHEFMADGDGRYRTADDLREVRCPVLLLWGTDDPVVLPSQSRHFTEALPDVELREVPGTGHFPQFDEPELVARAILDFTR